MREEERGERKKERKEDTHFRKKRRGEDMRKRMIIPRHEQKDGGLASDEGVTELIFALGTGPGRSPFMAQPDRSDRLAAVRSWRMRTKLSCSAGSRSVAFGAGGRSRLTKPRAYGLSVFFLSGPLSWTA